MRNIGLTDKWCLLALAIIALLAGCGGPRIVKVTTFPDLVSVEFERIGPCLVAEYRKIPVERQWSTGEVTQGAITVTATLRRSCR